MQERNYGNNKSVDLDFMINRLTLDTDLAQGGKKEYEYLSRRESVKKIAHENTKLFSNQNRKVKIQVHKK